LPAQVAMFNAMEGLNDTCERIAGLSLAGETVANYLIQMCLKSPDVPEWIKQPYRRITEDEEGHGSVPQLFLKRYATTEDRQDRSRCAWCCSANTSPASTAGRWARTAGSSRRLRIEDGGSHFYRRSSIFDPRRPIRVLQTLSPRREEQ